MVFLVISGAVSYIQPQTAFFITLFSESTSGAEFKFFKANFSTQVISAVIRIIIIVIPVKPVLSYRQACS